MFGTILVGTDGSGTASIAVEQAVGLAKASGATLVVLSAYPPPSDAAPPFADAQGYPGVTVAQGLLEDIERRYADEVSLRTIIREGEPADVIIEAAETNGVDLIVLGNKGMTGAKRFVIGSVPNTVSHHSPCDILIVHTTD